jgi:hypothetical protein
LTSSSWVSTLEEIDHGEKTLPDDIPSSALLRMLVPEKTAEE